MVKVTITVVNIPISDNIEIDLKAGCFANIKTPTPRIVVITDRIIDVLYVLISLLP